MCKDTQPVPDPPRQLQFEVNSTAAIEHIKLLQGIINRLAGNSASSKTWCLTLVGAVLSLAAATHVPAMVGFALIPVAVFGFLDVMYLAHEKSYHDLYKTIVQKLRLDTYGQNDVFNAAALASVDHIFEALTSWSIWPYYALVLAYWYGEHSGLFAALGKTAS